MRLSLCMIVRDNGEIIEECLASIRPWVDEMIVVDTGSRDDTARRAANMGAQVSEFVWIDDFSAARNASLQAASGEWVFWMDSDDVIDANCGRQLRMLADGPHEDHLLGYVIQVHCPGSEGPESGDVTVVDHVKMFRNRVDLRFEGRIHEQVLPAIRRAGGEVGWTDIFVVHKHGAVKASDKARKHERDLRILQLDLAERPEHPFVLFNLGMTCADMGRQAEAASYLERSIHASGPEESHLRKSFALLAACYLQMKKDASAARVCREGRARFPDDPEILFRSAVAAHQSGQCMVAENFYRQLLSQSQATEPQIRHFSSRVSGIAGHKARHNLAVLLSEQERWAEAELQWRLALDEAPQFQAALFALGEALIRQRKFQSANQLAKAWQANSSTHCAALQLRAKIAEYEDRREEAVELLRHARCDHEDRSEPLDNLARLLFESGRMSEAAEALSSLAEIRPDDPAVAHNLGSALLATGDLAAAISSLERSLALRPHSPATQSLLKEARTRNATALAR